MGGLGILCRGYFFRGATGAGDTWVYFFKIYFSKMKQLLFSFYVQNRKAFAFPKGTDVEYPTQIIQVVGTTMDEAKGRAEVLGYTVLGVEEEIEWENKSNEIPKRD